MTDEEERPKLELVGDIMYTNSIDPITMDVDVHMYIGTGFNLLHHHVITECAEHVIWGDPTYPPQYWSKLDAPSTI
jgi:hypothetical protein